MSQPIDPVPVSLRPLDLIREPKPPFVLSASPVYWSFSLWTAFLGAFLMAAPEDWYGITWHYFPQLPPNGFGMGVCLLVLGSLQMTVLWRRWGSLVLSILFFLSGFVFWAAGVFLFVAGMIGHGGLMMAPFILYVGAHKFTHSAVLMAHFRREKREREKVLQPDPKA